MASLEELIKTKSERLETVPQSLVSRTDKAQREIYDSLLDSLAKLDVVEGIIQPTTKNLAQVQVIAEDLKQIVFRSDYLDAVVDFASEFDDQSELVAEIFEKTFGNFSDKDVFNQTTTAARNRALDALSEDAVVQQFVNPIKNTLEAEVTGSGKFTDMVKLMNQQVLGSSEFDGTLLRYVKTIAFDAFATSDREYTNIVANDMGVIWFRYVGGLVTDSRVFCVNRNGKYYHKREIEDWGQGERIDSAGANGTNRAGNPWQGKNKATNGTNIFTLLGGWRCLHSLIPVSQVIVPKQVISRNKEKGYI